MRMGLGNNLAWTYLAGMPQFLNWANFLLRSSTRLVRYYSNVQCSTIYSFPVISRTQILVGWSGGLPSSILMESILVLKMLPGKILPRPLFTWPQGSGVQTNRDEGFYHLSLLWQQIFILYSPSGDIKSLTKMPQFCWLTWHIRTELWNLIGAHCTVQVDMAMYYTLPDPFSIFRVKSGYKILALVTVV